MLLRHATPRRNLGSIQRAGLLTSKSQGRLPAIWFHSPSRSAWATLHVVKRHGGRVEGVVIIEVEVPRSWLRRSRRGIWYVRRDVSPERFRQLIDFAEVAGTSVESR